MKKHTCIIVSLFLLITISSLNASEKKNNDSVRKFSDEEASDEEISIFSNSSDYGSRRASERKAILKSKTRKTGHDQNQPSSNKKAPTLKTRIAIRASSSVSLSSDYYDDKNNDPEEESTTY